MKKSIGVGLFGLFSVAAVEVFGAEAFEPPEWAYPIMEEGRGRGPDDGTIYTVEGSNVELTQTEINNRFGPADWYPDEHPPMPDIVAHGRQPDLWACDLCHLPTGAGHPESANLSGLPANYIFQQMKDFASGARKGILPGRPGIMVNFAGAITDEEIRIAADYFSSLPPVKWNDVVEVTMVPETFVGAGNMRHAIPGGGMEPIGMRIVELPTDSHGAELRDTHSPFIAYVPPGTLAKGEELATTGGGKTIQCAICHGPDLKGLGDVPSLAGRSPIYMARQLFEIKHGARTGSSAALMQGVVANLNEEDILNLVAYAGSLEP